MIDKYKSYISDIKLASYSFFFGGIFSFIFWAFMGFILENVSKEIIFFLLFLSTLLIGFGFGMWVGINQIEGIEND